MKIGLYLFKYGYGGGEKYQLFLARELYNKGFKIYLFSTDKSILNIGLPYHIIILESKGRLFLSRLLLFRSLTGYLRQLKLDYFFLFHNQDYVFFSNILSHTPILSSLRVSYCHNTKNILKKIFKLIWLGTSKGVVFQTYNVKKQAPGFIQKKSTVIFNALMIDNVQQLCKISRKHKIVAVGRLEESKGCLYLIDAFAQHASSHDYSLYFYGKGPLEEIMKQRISSYGMQNRVILAGYSNDIVSSISDSEIFVLNSENEGMPNSLIEAMSLELACISTRFDTGASEYLIQDGENGMLVDFGQINQLSDALYSLISNDDLRKKMQINAGSIRDTLAKNTIIDQWIVFMNELKHKSSC